MFSWLIGDGVWFVLRPKRILHFIMSVDFMKQAIVTNNMSVYFSVGGRFLITVRCSLFCALFISTTLILSPRIWDFLWNHTKHHLNLDELVTFLNEDICVIHLWKLPEVHPTHRFLCILIIIVYSNLKEYGNCEVLK